MAIKFFCRESRFLKMGTSLLTKLINEAKAANDVITLEATVITGFEPQAVEECKEKCKPVNIFRGKGRIFFNIKKDSYGSIFKLRAVDNLYMVNESFDNLGFTRNKEEDSEIIKNLVGKVDWKNSVEQWSELTGFQGIIFPKCAKRNPDEPLADNEPACQTCLGLLKQPETLTSENTLSANVEVAGNPGIEADTNSPSKITDCDKKDYTVPEIDGTCTKPTIQNDSSDDDNSFHSADDGSEAVSDPVKIKKDSKHIATVPDDEVSKSHEKCLLSEDLQNVGNGEDKSVQDEALLASDDVCQENELVSSSNEGTENGTVVEGSKKDCEANGSARGKTKRGKKMGYWQRRKEEEKKGTGRKKVPKAPPKPYIKDGIIKFRVTCHRSGKKHSFESNDAAMHFGGMINDQFHWTVDLTRWDINVVLVIEENSGYVTFGLTKESFHRRNISHFGPTTLRSTLCYNLIRFAEPSTGDIVIDPLCGGGSISIEGAKGFPKTFHICGDINEKCVARTKENLLFNTKTEPLYMDAFRWNAKSLPLRDQSVDVLVTDLPFGLRMGKWKDNMPLYDAVLRELARVVRSGGRAALLTYDQATMIKSVRKHSDVWREMRNIMVNHGGIKCVVFLLLRKALPTHENNDVKDPAMSLPESETVLCNQPEESNPSTLGSRNEPQGAE